MIKFETFEKIIKLLDDISLEADNFNDGLQKVLGSDSCCMYYEPCEIVKNSTIEILQMEFNETKEGAEWFIYEGLPQIKNGGTSIEENGKIWDIKNIKDYYDYLVSLQNQLRTLILLRECSLFLTIFLEHNICDIISYKERLK